MGLYNFQYPDGWDDISCLGWARQSEKGAFYHSHSAVLRTWEASLSGWTLSFSSVNKSCGILEQFGLGSL